MSLRYIVSNKVTVTIRIKNTKAPIKSILLNFTSQYNPIKNAATKKAFTKAIDRAVIISRGAGIGNDDTTTVRMVSTTNAPPINHNWKAEAT